MTWTADYTPGDPVRCRYQAGWRGGQVVAVRKNSLMVLLVRGSNQQTINIHDPRNVEPCQKRNPPSTSNDQQSFA
jgi:hypothetical protein